MKRFVLFLLVLGVGVSLFAQVQLPEPYRASGNWSFGSDGRFYQNDASARLAKANIRIPQNGQMLYQFTARYEGGGEDGQGGFGVHIFADDIYHRASWGNGTSYLLWLNYDENPVSRDIPRGLSAQVYRSYSSARMDLVASVSLSQYENALLNSLSEPIPFTIWVNGNTGEIRVYDPSDPNLGNYYYFFADQRFVPLKGDWVALRTNGLRASFRQGTW